MLDLVISLNLSFGNIKIFFIYLIAIGAKFLNLFFKFIAYSLISLASIKLLIIPS